jgi:VCBS repeat-containing protein
MISLNKLKKATIVFMALTFFIVTLAPSLYASSINMTAYTTLEIGGTTTITITGSDVTGRFNISTSNAGIVSLNSSSVWVENNSVSVTATAKAAGTATITLTPNDVSNGVGTDITGTIGTKTITIKVNEVPKNNPTPPTTPTTNSNANLKKLVPNYEGLSPNFNPSTTKYSLAVPATATNLGLTVAVDGAGAKYWISGDENLKMGDNTVTITVTATDGTKKVYTIIVTKANNVAQANAYLSSIVIDGKTLSPEFTAENLEYNIGTVTSDVEKLTILAFAQSESSKVVITGNDPLVDGENIIKINVTAEDEATTKEYIVKVNKEAAAEVIATNESESVVDIYPETNSLENLTGSKLGDFTYTIWMYLREFWLTLALLLFSIFEFIQIIYLYKKVKMLTKVDEIEENVQEEKNEISQPRRRNADADNNDNNISEEINDETSEIIDDTFDETIDGSEEGKIQVEDSTDNFDDSKDIEEDK